MSQPDPRISLSLRGHVALVGIHRAAKRNAFDMAMLHALAHALTEADQNEQVRCSVVYAEGAHFTAGLDLADVGPRVGSGELMVPEGAVDPFHLFGKRREKPLLVAVQGICFTLGVELMLAADMAVAASDARFAQLEVKRGIFPFGGATLRFPQVAGWGNAMRWLLTGDEFGAAEAYRMGIVQEVVEPGQQLDRALALAEAVARQAPLAVQATLASARLAREQGPEAAAQDLMPRLRRIHASEDVQEGLRSFIERREARFQGK
ncbi:crotonase/enoyl-CoA hydratase family protein [Cystobacter fuscus]|uniref:crotonase/enoyl-CoA hydratase family protein n=1 Tax=Cystobacter fuscus TaxID=43 RepID=UPI002B309699|nr:crotonase/enoyl-CoA hydratase family protein [Cystobacter fuscus]